MVESRSSHPRTNAGVEVIGRAPRFRQVVELVRRIAARNVPVLLQGETGTGKEVLARMLHYESERRGSAFVPVNCGAIPDALIESELFGHARGAFTDARQERKGLVEEADGGTLFLDEIDTVSPRGQVAMLRFLQSREYRPVGSPRLRRADVRVVTATNRNIGELVRERLFREDLFFRINVVRLEVPPLRTRRGDALILARHFVEKFCREYRFPAKQLDPAAGEWLERHNWPGNVRELENLIHRAVLFAEEADRIELVHLARPDNDDAPASAAPLTLREAKERVVSKFERMYLDTLLAETFGNVTLAARLAGKERRSLGKLLKKHGIDRKHYQEDAVPAESGSMLGEGAKWGRRRARESRR